MKLHTATSLTALLSILASTAANPLPDLDEGTTSDNTTSIDGLQKRAMSAKVWVCNGYDGHCGGSHHKCNLVTLNVGTWADTTGTVCWVLEGDPAPKPVTIPNIVFCNKSLGKGTCKTSGDCAVAPDSSCAAKGTNSMGMWKEQ